MSKDYFLAMMDHAQSQFAKRYPRITLVQIIYLIYATLANVQRTKTYVLYLTMDAHSYSPRNVMMAGVSRHGNSVRTL